MGGSVDIIVFVIILDLFGIGNDNMFIISGNIDLVVGSIVIIIVIDSVGIV